MKKDSKFNETITRILGDRLGVFSERKLDLVTCVEIYQVVFNTLADSLSQVNAPLDNECVNYLAQQYYDGILINGREELDENIFTQRAKLENIDTKQLALMAVMLNGTDFALPIIQEVKRRS